MAFDPEQAEIIRLRLQIGQLLDNSARMSFLESAHFRIELMVALEHHEKQATTTSETIAALRNLHRRVSAIATPDTYRSQNAAT